MNYAALANKVSDYPVPVNMDGPMTGSFELSSDGTTCTISGYGPPMTYNNCDCSENFNFVDEGKFLNQVYTAWSMK